MCIGKSLSASVLILDPPILAPERSDTGPHCVFWHFQTAGVSVILNQNE